MYNEIFSIGPLTIRGYGLMIGIGVLAALAVALFRAKRKHINTDHIYNLTFLCLVFGFLGAKLLYGIVDWKTVIQNPLTLITGNGFVVFGGIIGGVITSMVYCSVKKISFPQIFDLLIPEIAIAQGFGRIGCLLAGCCYGRHTDSSIGIIFRHSDYAPNNVKLVPTQIIFSICAFALAILLIIYSRYNKRDGEVGALYIVLYSIGRFFLEFLRGDYRGTVFGFLSTSQFIAIITLLMGICYFAVLRIRKPVHLDTK